MQAEESPYSAAAPRYRTGVLRKFCLSVCLKHTQYLYCVMKMGANIQNIQNQIWHCTH